MVLYTKYSNERRRAFGIRTEIRQEEDGAKQVCKLAEFPEAEDHIRSLEWKCRRLQEDLPGTALRVNPCVLCKTEASVCACFPFREGRTLEEELDELLAQKRTEELVEKIERYFAVISDAPEQFAETEAFREVFGSVSFQREQRSRRVSDIDLVFANVLRTSSGYELIDYEWTFEFPVPVRYLLYRCLHYYLYGTAGRDVLLTLDLFARFDISEEEQRQFAAMERSFQQYILGDYTPIWKLYGAISEGVIPVLPLVKQVSGQERAMRCAEVFFDDGRGFGTWSQRQYPVEPEGQISLRIELPGGTRALRIDPCSARCLVRIVRLCQGGEPLAIAANGEPLPNGDYLFDTEDPQLVIASLPHGTEAVELVYFAEPIGGLSREALLAQNGRLRWMEQTKAWKLYRKLKPGC